MTWLPLRLIRPVFAFLLGMASLGAAAASFEVAPVLLELQGTQRVTSFTVTNREDHPQTIQVRPMAWTQERGQDNLAATNDLQVSPPMFTLGNGESQLVRVFSRVTGVAAGSASDGQRERAYRFLIDEIPAPGEISAVHMTLRISIPLFIYAGRAGTPMLDWKVVNENGAPPALAVSNNGSRHAKLSALVVTDEKGVRHEVAGARSAYLLPGARRTWRLEGWSPEAQPDKAVAVSGSTDIGEISAQAPRVSLQ